jgi:hypothetical protein
MKDDYGEYLEHCDSDEHALLVDFRVLDDKARSAVLRRVENLANAAMRSPKKKKAPLP